MEIKSRLNLKIEADLKDWAMEYAQRQGTTLTNIICSYFRKLREEEAKSEELVEQI